MSRPKHPPARVLRQCQLLVVPPRRREDARCCPCRSFFCFRRFLSCLSDPGVKSSLLSLCCGLSGRCSLSLHPVAGGLEAAVGGGGRGGQLEMGHGTGEKCQFFFRKYWGASKIRSRRGIWLSVALVFIRPAAVCYLVSCGEPLSVPYAQG